MVPVAARCETVRETRTGESPDSKQYYQSKQWLIEDLDSQANCDGGN